ncbi:sugar ABC transporter ATP-binding protein [Terriglobus albidus]|uniref:sugar ABC transporter ATP-binding protein n=1 Tax=Terriglobus albidus TaxID=1592106 RepID=UPI0021E0AC5F|nr:sugar ABC transporter ATP-binding protein [Terriglobus albidus]
MQNVSSNSAPPLAIAAKSLTKSYAGVRALRSGSLELLPGEVHALIGENGAGKSTLTKIITGAIQPDSGELEIFGQRISENDPNRSRALGVAAIYQQPAIFPHLTVAENICMPLERERGGITVDWRSRKQRAKELIHSIGANIDPDRLAGTLSMAEQQVVEIAKAIGAKARILLMDEPTALLSERETEKLFTLVKRLRSEGVAIIYISHRLEEILSLADRITVLRDGETIACCNAGDVDRAKLIELMVGRSIESVFPKRTVVPGDVAIAVKDLNNPEAGLHDISFSVRKGEIFGLAGLVGSGRTELARTLFGITPVHTSITLHGREVTIGSPAEAIAKGLGYLPEDRRQHGVILDMSIASNITLASLNDVAKRGLLDSNREQSVAEAYRTSLRIKAPATDTVAGALSGGNQQKVALARWLAIKPGIMILDEPTQGVDVGSKSEIHELIVEFAERGMAVILISSELPEVLGMSDRIGVFYNGTIVATLSREEATQQKVMSLAFGHEVQA